MIQGISENQTGTLEKNLILLWCGQYDSHFISVVCLEGALVTGLVNLVQLTLLFHAEHMLSQEPSGWEGPKRC